jgi:Uma2 family endonuclease
MGLPQPVKRYTPQEYYALEHEAESKSDYYKGEIFAMAGGTARHSLICNNIGGEMRSRLKGKPCTVYESNLRLKVVATGLRSYPDVSVYCEPLQIDDEDPNGQTYTNPAVVFEVLSKSTEAYDRGFKSLNYRRLPSLRAYVIVSQDTPSVEIYERQPDGRWILGEAAGMDATLSIAPLSIDLPLTEIYDRVDFTDYDAVPPPT